MFLLRKADFCTEGIMGWAGTDDVEQWVPDEGDGNAPVAEKNLFEREDDSQAVYEAPKLLDPALTPSPDLGTDVIEDRDPKSLGAACQEEIEFRIIDEDQEARSLCAEPANGCAEGPNDGTKVFQNFNEAHDG